MICEYRKKPVIILACKWDGTNIEEVNNFTHGEAMILPVQRADGIIYSCSINTLEGRMSADIGDYIIRGVKGEYYPCKPDVFETTYEVVQ